MLINLSKPPERVSDTSNLDLLATDKLLNLIPPRFQVEGPNTPVFQNDGSSMVPISQTTMATAPLLSVVQSALTVSSPDNSHPAEPSVTSISSISVQRSSRPTLLYDRFSSIAPNGLSLTRARLAQYVQTLPVQNDICTAAGTNTSIERFKYLADLPDKYFIAANFHNNEPVLPHFIAQLLELISFFGRDRIFVSVFESGSTDNTKPILRDLDAFLEDLGLSKRIITSDEIRDPKGHRIEYLAHVRNEAMKPLYESSTHYDRVIFMNDVFYCADDIKELIHQSRLQKSDITCGLDFGPRGIWMWPDITFYDNWVAHDLEGNMFDFTSQNFVLHKPSNERYKQGLPFQVSCCWNGIAVLNTEPFMESHRVRFRRIVSKEINSKHLSPEVISRILPTNTKYHRVYESCSASECSNICWDFANKGFDRMVVVPRVRVTYDFPSFATLRASEHGTSRHQDVPARFPLDAPFKPEESERIEFGPMPPSVFCLPLDRDGDHGPDWSGKSTAGWLISNSTEYINSIETRETSNSHHL
ncbi:capsular associated protein [Quaeritorhiza haematococci]|nr:capsular associated protein [Quaeritorhiza haematococci]